MVKPAGQKQRPVGFFEMFGNSLLYSVSMSVFTIATQVMVAYACAKYNFKGRNLLYNIAIVVMIIPIIGSLASEMQFAEALNFRNSFIGVCIMRCKYPGIYFLVFYATFKSISWTYAEAAQIDGASHIKIFFNIMLPLISSTLTAVFVLQFIANFNDYQTPMIFIPNSPTIAYGLFLYKSDPQNSPTSVLAATMFSCLPVFILFIIFRNKIMGNVNVGGIKG
jgi:ABC-type glycerol-3-phosphate transport system permease component